jgi:hypothetical protein
VTQALLLPAPATYAPSSLILQGTRCWRKARDSGRPVQPALYHLFGSHRGGFLAPAIAGLITIYESYTSRAIRIGGSYPTTLSTDEQRLLNLVIGSADIMTVIADAANSNLAGAMRIAVRSTQIMMRLALGSAAHLPPSTAPAYLLV